jgi:hypothetical protein
LPMSIPLLLRLSFSPCIQLTCPSEVSFNHL